MFEELVPAIQAHAIAEYPEECCGLIISGDYFPTENTAPEPTKHFRMKSEDWLAATKVGTIEAVVHSHPDGPDCPSAADMRRQEATDVPWGIVSCNGTGALPPFWWGGDCIEPLVGRGFRHGVTDCYGLIKDYYRLELGITLPVGPRDWDWWREGGDLYQDNFPRAGFVRISENDVKPGDVFLAQICSDVPNHGGVYVGSGLGLHHLTAKLAVDPTRLSRREPIDRWRKFITHWLRYTK